MAWSKAHEVKDISIYYHKAPRTSPLFITSIMAEFATMAHFTYRHYIINIQGNSFGSRLTRFLYILCRRVRILSWRLSSLFSIPLIVELFPYHICPFTHTRRLLCLSCSSLSLNTTFIRAYSLTPGHYVKTRWFIDEYISYVRKIRVFFRLIYSFIRWYWAYYSYWFSGR